MSGQHHGIGWDLILEYAVGNVAVAISWSGYFQALLSVVGMSWPDWLGIDCRSAAQAAHVVESATDPSTISDATRHAAAAFAHAPHLFGIPILFNLPAAAIVMLVTWVLVVGIRESAWFNTSMVDLKLAIIAFFVIFGAFFIDTANWHPFAPNGTAGIFSGAAIIFFAYIGFDSVSTHAEEAKQPQRDVPIGIIASLVVCTVLYRITNGLQVNNAYFKKAEVLVLENLDVPRPQVIVLGDQGNVEEYVFDRRDRRFHVINMGFPDERFESFDTFEELLLTVMTHQQVLA